MKAKVVQYTITLTVGENQELHWIENQLCQTIDLIEEHADTYSSEIDLTSERSTEITIE